MPLSSQSISTCLGMSGLFTLNVQGITQCSLYMDPFNTSTLLSYKREIPNHFKLSETKLVPSSKEPSCFNRPNLFLIHRDLSWCQLHSLLRQLRCRTLRCLVDEPT